MNKNEVINDTPVNETKLQTMKSTIYSKLDLLNESEITLIYEIVIRLGKE